MDIAMSIKWALQWRVNSCDQSLPLAMATSANHSMLIMVLLLLGLTCLNVTVGQVGVCFGRLGDNLPSVQRTIALYKQNNIRRMRLYDPHPGTLRALSGTGIRLMLGVEDAHLQDLANCPQAAVSWVRSNVQSYPNVTFRYIAVGNEIAPESAHAHFVLPAMQNIYRAIRAAGLGGQIKVSTSVKTDLLNTSFPPDEGEFKCSVNWFIRPIVEFLRDTRAPLLANIYPYFAYMDDPKNINLSFALLQPNSGVFANGIYYDNLFYAILDAVYAAMEKLLAVASPLSLEGELASTETPNVTTSETGNSSHDKKNVPSPTPPPPHLKEPESVGDGPLSTVENARIYNNNLMRIVRNGTPKRPGRPIEAYIFAMFDENRKPGPEYERHFGIFLPNGQPKYRLRFR